jgi:hypothetical protein
MRNAARWGLMDDPRSPQDPHRAEAAHRRHRHRGGDFLSAGYWLGRRLRGWSGRRDVAFSYLDATRCGALEVSRQILAMLLLMVGGVVIDQVPLMGFELAPTDPLPEFFFVLGVIVNVSDG